MAQTVNELVLKNVKLEAAESTGKTSSIINHHISFKVQV
jgi:hypothetical protein